MDDVAGTIARRIYQETNLCPDLAVEGGAVEIATRLGLGVYDHPRARDEATVARWGGQERIVLRSGLEPARAHFKVAEMIARVWGSGAALEPAVGAWLVAPPGPFKARWEAVGADVAALARPFAVTRTTALLRLHEVVGLDVAMVGRRAIRRRGRRFEWLSDAALRELAAKRTTKSVRKVALRDDGGAVGLVAC